MADEKKDGGMEPGTYSYLLKRQRSFNSVSARIGDKEETVLEFCKKTSRGCHILWGSNVIQSFTMEKCRHRGSFAAAIWGDHLYAYSDSNTKHSIALTNPKKISAQKFEILGKPGGESQIQLHEYTPFDKMEPGKFWTNSDEMEKIKNDLLRQGIVPKIRMKNFLEVRQIQVHGKEDTTILALPPNWDLIQQFNAELSFLKGKKVLDYQGQGLASFTTLTLAALLRPDRQELTLENGRCEVCGVEAWLQKDHIVPVSLGGTSEGQLLCQACHSEKSKTEDSCHRHSRGSSLNPMMSHFNKHTWDDFTKNKPLQLVTRINEPKGNGLLIDVKRCRRNALTSGWELPVFSALDDIKPFYGRRLRRRFLLCGSEGAASRHATLDGQQMVPQVLRGIFAPHAKDHAG